MAIYEDDLLKTVSSLIKEEWRPKKHYSKEIKYRDDMLDFLRSKIGSEYHMRTE